MSEHHKINLIETLIDALKNGIRALIKWFFS